MERPIESRLAEVLAALSVATDLAMGLPVGHAIRASLAATRLGRQLSLRDGELTTVYYTTLLRYVGCTAFSHEEARLSGNDVAARRAGASVDFSRPREALAFMIHMTAGMPAGLRARTLGGAFTGGREFDRLLKTANCEVAARTAERLGLGGQISASLYQIFERWDGKGAPTGLAGDRVALASRLANIVHCALLAQEIGGVELGDAVVRDRSGSWLDPELSGAYLRTRADLWPGEHEDAWREGLNEEPHPVRSLLAKDVPALASAFADLADLKSPFLHGHARAVAAYCVSAGRAAGLGDAQVAALELAALLHDIGRVAVPTSTWEKAGPLTQFEWDQVRQHPFHTERILGRAPLLSDVAQTAALHHERLDGSGYHRQLPARLLTLPARLLAAADAFAAMVAERPYRPALSIERAARELESAAHNGKLDPDAAGAVLAAHGRHLSRRARHWPRGLSDREVEVLRRLAAGESKREIADHLFISGSTAHTHVVHIYEKLGVRTRAGAALFAMENGLYLLASSQESTV